MILGFHHAAISTPDMDRFLDFYTKLLGCEPAWDMEWPKGTAAADELTGLTDSAAKGVMLKLGDSYLEVFEFSSPEARSPAEPRPVCDHGITHICLQVEDIHGEYQRLRSAGMEFHCAPMEQDSGWLTYGRDPDGNVVELIQFGK